MFGQTIADVSRSMMSSFFLLFRLYSDSRVFSHFSRYVPDRGHNRLNRRTVDMWIFISTKLKENNATQCAPKRFSRSKLSENESKFTKARVHECDTIAVIGIYDDKNEFSRNTEIQPCRFSRSLPTNKNFLLSRYCVKFVVFFIWVGIFYCSTYHRVTRVFIRKSFYRQNVWNENYLH